MATISLSFKPDRKKGGLGNIKIVLSHHKTKAVFGTPFWVFDGEFKHGVIVNRPDAVDSNARLHALLTRYCLALEKVSNPDLFTCPRLRRMIEAEMNAGGSMLFSVCAASVIMDLRKDHRDSYACMVERSARYFNDMIGDMPLAAIRPEHIKTYTSLLVKRKVSEAYVNICLSHVKMILNKAISEGQVKYDMHPFISTKIRRSQPKETVVSVQSIRMIRDCKPDAYSDIVARDMFMLSFYLGGMNLVDILKADFKGDEVSFMRTKTKTRCPQVTVLPIIPQAKEIIKRYKGGGDKIKLRYGSCRRDMLAYVSKRLTLLAKKIGIKEKVVFYSARKTFAQIGLDLEIPDSVIDAALGHSNASRGIISYYSKVKVEQIKKAIEDIVAVVSTP